jgi:hypothetical protein
VLNRREDLLLEDQHVSAHHVEVQLPVYEEETARVLKAGDEPEVLVDQVEAVAPGLGKFRQRTSSVSGSVAMRVELL